MRQRREAPPAHVRIAQSRISRLGAHLLGVPRGGLVAPAVVGLERHAARLAAIGFTPPVEEGQVLLPAVVGRRTRFNADGDDRPERQLPKERVPSLTSVPRGRVAPDERGVHNWSYARYPRTRIPGPNVELRIVADGRGAPMIASETFRRGEDDARLTHTINLLLEIFGECLLLRDDPTPPGSPVTRLNWSVCAADPEGRAATATFAAVIDDLAPPMRAVARHRLRRVMELQPDFVAVGRAGYRGCGVFGFARHRRFVVESLFHDNATHVSARGWEELSRRPKSDLLAGLPGDQPIPHARGWEAQLRAAVEF